MKGQSLNNMKNKFLVGTKYKYLNSKLVMQIVKVGKKFIYLNECVNLDNKAKVTKNDFITHFNKF
jgi:hypothetical protein